MRLPLLFIAAVALELGCQASKVDGRFPPRPAGCDVKTFRDVAPMSTENIGPVTATCDESTSETDCLRVLADEACKLGGDVVWGVGELDPRPQGKRKLAGRAARSTPVGK